MAAVVSRCNVTLAGRTGTTARAFGPAGLHGLDDVADHADFGDGGGQANHVADGDPSAASTCPAQPAAGSAVDSVRYCRDAEVDESAGADALGHRLGRTRGQRGTGMRSAGGTDRLLVVECPTGPAVGLVVALSGDQGDRPVALHLRDIDRESAETDHPGAGPAHGGDLADHLGPTCPLVDRRTGPGLVGTGQPNGERVPDRGKCIEKRAAVRSAAPVPCGRAASAPFKVPGGTTPSARALKRSPKFPAPRPKVRWAPASRRAAP